MLVSSISGQVKYRDADLFLSEKYINEACPGTIWIKSCKIWEPRANELGSPLGLNEVLGFRLCWL